jgi:hypothetical protein
MNAFSKTIIAASIAAASIFSGTAAAAEAPFNQFTVAPGGIYSNFTADNITGKYTEQATFNLDGSFNVSLRWTAGQFATDQGNTTLQAFETGLGSSYGLFATYSASGNYSTTNGVTTFTFQPGSGALQLFLDTDLRSPAGDVLLGFGDPIDGEGSLTPGVSTCSSSGINCGSFGASSTLQLTEAGSQFFILPNPFYSVTFQSGQLNTFEPIGSQTINGSLDVTFGGLPAEVPEPASVGLLGLGMLGLYAARRRNKKAA